MDEENNDFLTREQLAKLLQISDKQVYLWEREGLPVIDLGHRTKRYNYQKVKEWLINKKSS